MGQREVLILESGQPNLRSTVPRLHQALRLLLKDPKSMISAIAELMTIMHNKPEQEDIFFSYVNNEVFRDMTEEKFISVIQPVDFFKGAIAQIKVEHSGIECFNSYEKNGIIVFNVTIKKPDWDLEQLIYNKFAELSNLYKDKEFDIEIEELFK